MVQKCNPTLTGRSSSGHDMILAKRLKGLLTVLAESNGLDCANGETPLKRFLYLSNGYALSPQYANFLDINKDKTV